MLNYMKGWFYVSDRRRLELWKVRFPYDRYDRMTENFPHASNRLFKS